MADEKAKAQCKTCGGVGVIHSGEPTMYNCELGGDCSEDPNWTEEQCKTCGKIVPCPECKPEANEYYLLWERDCKNMNLAQAENAKLKEAIKWLLETVKWVRDNETCNAYNDEYLKKRCSGILGSDFDKIMGEQDE